MISLRINRRNRASCHPEADMRTRKIIRRLVWTLIAFVTLIAMFYSEEDWRGARAWQEAQATYKKAGESLDYARFIPPPIPDDQNLAALPLFALSPASKTEPYLRPVALEKALRPDDGLPQLPSTGSWQRGQAPDMNKIRNGVASIYAVAFKGARAPASSLAQFEAVFPVVADLRQASASRTSCRFNQNYRAATFLRPISLLTDQIAVTRIMTLDAVLALDAHQPAIALADLRTVFVLSSGMRHDPSLVAGVISIAMDAISETAVADGLALHAWNDAQLAQLQDQLGQMDFLVDFKFAIRGEVAGQLLGFQMVRQKMTHQFQAVPLPVDAEENHLINFYLPWPGGWVDASEGRLVRFTLSSLPTINPATHRVYPDLVRKLQDERHRKLFLGRYVFPWDFLFIEWSMDPANLASKSAYVQTRIDQSVLACALERYRLAHGNYPSSLDALRPDYCTSIPTDVINGEPYHYRMLPDGSYRLYSVGWNGKDDGGTLVYKEIDYTPTSQIDYDQGDWVWFGPK
jgi:hypothetical protein